MGFSPAEKRPLHPFPIAVDILKTDLAKPRELKFQHSQLIRRTLVCRRNSASIQKTLVKLRCRRGHMLQITEYSATGQGAENLCIDFLFSSVVTVVDSEPRYDGI